MRILALIDGFNVYHSLIAAEKQVEVMDRFNTSHGKQPLKLAGRNFHWLDIPSLVRSYMPQIGRDATIAEMVYFSAFAKHAGRERVTRHELYVDALRAFGVRAELSYFKDKEITCPKCKIAFTRKEEKETDVALACALVEGALRPEVDAYLLFSGDTDQLPAIRTAKRLHPEKPLFVLFPFQRHAKTLEAEARTGGSWKVDLKAMDRWRWPKHLTLPDGRVIERPPEYDG